MEREGLSSLDATGEGELCVAQHEASPVTWTYSVQYYLGHFLVDFLVLDWRITFNPPSDRTKTTF